MHISYKSVLLALLALSDVSLAARKPSNSVLLTQVKTLTLRKDSKTSHRRVSAIPQLKCVGGSAKGLFEVDVMRCKNQGSDYDDDNVQVSTIAVPKSSCNTVTGGCNQFHEDGNTCLTRTSRVWQNGSIVQIKQTFLWFVIADNKRYSGHAPQISLRNSVLVPQT